MSTSAEQVELPQELARVYPPFLALLQSSSEIAISDDTLYGAITHFLAVLPLNHLETFVNALTTSKSLWSRPSSSHGTDATSTSLTMAMRHAVSSKVERLRQELSNVYFPIRRTNRRAREWLGAINMTLSLHKTLAAESIQLGLLEGVEAELEVDWGQAREELELEMTSVLEEKLGSRKAVSLCLIKSIPLLDDTKVRLLDVQIEILESQLLDHFKASFLQAEASLSPVHNDIAIHSQAVAKLIKAFSGGGRRSRDKAVDLARHFIQIMSDATRASELAWVGAPEGGGVETHKTVLFASLQPSLAIMDAILLSFSHPPTDLARSILYALANMSYLTAGAASGMEGWDRLFYGCLDVMAATRTQIDLQDIADGSSGDTRAAFALVVAEQLMPHVDVQVVLLLAEKYLQLPSARPAFEAAHSFMLALLRGASESNTSGQDAFTEELVHFYGAVVLQQTHSKDLTADQTRAAYAEVMKTAAALSNAQAQKSILALDVAARAQPSQTLKLTRLAVIPHVPVAFLGSFLDEMAEIIVGSSDPDRATLSIVAFKVIQEELGDEGKEIGMKWWFDWRERLQGPQSIQTKAKL